MTVVVQQSNLVMYMTQDKLLSDSEKVFRGVDAYRLGMRWLGCSLLAVDDYMSSVVMFLFVPLIPRAVLQILGTNIYRRECSGPS